MYKRMSPFWQQVYIAYLKNFTYLCLMLTCVSLGGWVTPWFDFAR